MAEFKAAVEIDVKASSGANQSLKGFKAQMRELKLEAQQAVMQFGEFSPEALKAQQAVASLDDKMQDFNDRVKALNPDKFSKVLTITQGVTQGFQAAQGAMALFGSESEDLQKTLVKVQGAMALAQGLEGLGKIQQQFVAIGQTILGPVLNAFKAFGNGARAAIASTGIGLLIVALGTIVAYWDDIKKALTGVNSETEKLNKQTTKNVELSKEQTEQFEQQVNSLKLQGKSEREIEQMRIKAYDNEIQRNIDRLKFLKSTQQSQIDATQRNFEYVNTGLKIIYAPIYAMLKIIDLTRRAIGQQSDLANEATASLTKLVFDPEAVKKESEKTIKETEKGIRELESKRNASRLNIQKIDQEAAQKAKEQSDERARIIKENLDKEYQYYLEQAKQLKDVQDKQITDTLSAKDKELFELEKRRQADLRNANASALSRKATEERYNIERNQIEIKYAEADLRAKIDALDRYDKFTKWKDKKDKLIAEQRFNDTIALTANSLNTISALNEAFAGKTEEEQRKAFEMDKALKYASTILSTIEGVQSAYTTAMKSPLTVVFPAYPYVQAAAASLFGIAQLKKISDTKYQSKTTPTASGSAAPNANGIPNMAAPQIASMLPTNQLTQERKVYVTEGDISRVQRRVANNQMVSVIE